MIRFIVPITRAQLEHSRGMDVINQLKVIQNMINVDGNTIGKSIQPILTKCDPSDTKFDIDVTRFVLDQQIQNHLTTMKTQATHQMTQIQQTSQFETTEEREEDQRRHEEYFQDLQEFFQAFTYKLEVFDPLDRPICNADGEEQAIKRDQLLLQILKMPCVEASKLMLPISNRCLLLLQKFFDSMQDHCN